MTDDLGRKARYGEAFWLAHHEAWKRSDLNQQEYCEAQGLKLKAWVTAGRRSRPRHICLHTSRCRYSRSCNLSTLLPDIDRAPSQPRVWVRQGGRHRFGISRCAS